MEPNGWSCGLSASAVSGSLTIVADFLADQVGDQRVAVDVDALVGPELGQDVDEVAGGPRLLEALAALGIAELPAHTRSARKRHAGQRPARLLAVAGAVAFQQARAIRRRAGRCGREGRKFGVRWNTVSCAACSAISGIDWMPDDPVPITATRLPAKFDLVMRPAAGEIDLALEVLDAVDLRRLRRGEAAGRHDVVAAGDCRAVVGREQPAFASPRPRSPR